MDVAGLQDAVNSETGLSMEAQVAAVAALVHAKATLLAVDAWLMYKDSITHDVAMPLTSALRSFPEAAANLTTALRRLPDR